MDFLFLSRKLKHKRCLSLLACATLFFALSQAAPASAKSVMWQGGTSSDWNTGSNWVWDGGVPGTGDTANIGSNTAVASPVIGAGASGTAGLLVVGGGYTGTLDVQGTLSTAQSTLGNDQASKLAVGTVTVAGSSASWTNTGDLYVGNYSIGALNIQNHAQVSANLVNMGAEVGSSGTVNLTGSGSALNSAANLFVGYGGSGTLNIGNGTAVTSVGGVLGNNAGGSGTATIDGGSWNTGTGTILIGGNGQGDLTIQNGGTLTSTGGTVGWGATAATTSTATVTGTGSKWISSDSLYVGNNATGILNIQSGGEVSTTQSLFVGSNSGSNGTVNLTGSGAGLNVTDGLYVGYQGTGALNVGAGTTVTTGGLNIATGTGGVGTATIDGSGATLTATSGGSVGSETNSHGSLTVSGGGVLSTVSGTLYVQGGSTMTVSGTDSKVNIGTAHSGVPATWSDSDGWLYIHQGSATVESGATLEADGVYVSGAPGGAGSLTVTGPGTVLDGKLCIYVGGDGNDSGTTGDGLLTISNGATATATIVAAGNDTGLTGTILLTGAGSSLTTVPNVNYVGNVYAGYTSDGAITVQDGASLTAAGALRVGWADGSTGTVNVESGSTATSANGVIGYESNATGTVTVTGSGSTWTNNDEIVVGWSGTGTMTVEAGATVTNAHEGTVGYQAGSHGTVTVTGPGSTWTNGGELVVGWSGTGEMTISDGGKVTNTNGFLGARDGGSGTATVTGAGSTWESSGQLILGYGASTGLLTIENGGKVINSDGRIGLSANSTGTVTVTGANSTLTDNGAILRVGYDGTGTLTIAEGGQVTIGTETGGVYDGAVTIASNAGSTGTLIIGAAEGSSAAAAGTLRAASVVFGSGTGEIIFNHTSSGLQFDSAISGAGAVKVLAGTTVFTGASTYSGATTITEGALKAGAANTFSGNSAVAVGATGTLDLNNYDQTIGGLSGSGTVSLGSGMLTVNSAADSTFSGTISGTGGLTKDGSGVLTLSGDSDYSGATTINGGTLRAGAVNVFSENSIVTVNANGTLDLNNFDQTIVDLSGTGMVVLGSATLTVTNNTAVNDFTLTGTGGVTKTGTGTLTLSGSGSDYSGETAVTAGTLQAGATNAFSPNSTVSVSTGGTLDLNNYSQAVGGLTGSGAVTLGSGTLTVGNTAANTFSGSISGTGGLTKTGSGSLTLSGDNSYTGATTIQQGTLSLTGSTASSSMAVSSGAVLDFSPSRNLSYTGAISGDGAVTKTGGNTLTLTGNNSYTGGTTISSGTVSISSDANLGASTGALALAGGTLETTAAVSTSRPITVTGGGTIDNTGNAVTLSGNLLGSGNLTLAGSGTDTLDATFNGSSYTGTLTRSGGVLHLVSGGTLGGTLAIDNGATLNGVGTVSNLNLNGSIAPGNSPGTLTVTGNYVQGANGVYVCDVTPTANDLIAVTGSATLGGTLSIAPEYTYYNSGTVWNVLTAAGGVSGTYATVTYGATPENWIFVPVYSANAVTVTLARQSYSNSATSSQASSVGSGLDAAAYNATGEMATLIKSLDYSYGTNAMYSASNALADYALNVLSPEYYATFSQNVFEAGRLLTGAQRAGLHEGQGEAAAASPLNFGPAAVASQNADNGGIPAGIPGANGGKSFQTLSLGRFGVFLKPLGLRASQQGRSDQTGYVTLAGGITGGLLYRPTPELTLGLAPGYVNQSLSLHSEGGGQGTINDWSLALLAAYRQGGFYADAGLRGAYDNFRSSRALPLPAGKYTAKANWDGWSMSASVGGGYDFSAGDFTYGPLASVSWQRLHENGFTEKGAGTVGQSVRARDTYALNTVLGGHVSRTFETTVGTVTPEVRAAWSAQWLGDSQNIVATFIGSPSSAYRTKTKDQRYNSALVDLGVTVGLSDSLAATARVGVELFRPGYAAQAASVGLKFSF
jgi:T5SS/PEP-CTERM-associated repeat protein/autotransporter-associated beta strand protein